MRTSSIRTRRGIVTAAAVLITSIGLIAVGTLALASSAVLPAASVSAPGRAPEVADKGTAGTEPTTTQPSTAQATIAGPCPAGQIPLLNISAFPRADRGGASTPEAALRAAAPATRILDLRRMGMRPEAPAWIVTEGGTFIATILRDGTWFAAPATLIDCHAP